MITKLVLFLMILTTWYGVSVFVAPEVASSIDKIIGLPGLSDNLRGTKENLEGAVTDIPSIEELKSWAVDIQKKISSGAEMTKDTIDSIRWWAQKVEETYNDAKETFDDAKQVLDSATDKISNIKQWLDDVEALWNSITNVVNTDAVE